MRRIYAKLVAELANMNDKAFEILGSNRLMAISTVRPDDWPQTTVVGYANDEFTIYFLIFRASQKFANIAQNDRVSLAVFREPADMHLAEAFYAGAVASEVTDPVEREHGWRLLAQRHRNLAPSIQPDWALAALMRAECRHVSVLDYNKGLGHADALHMTGSEEER